MTKCIKILIIVLALGSFYYVVGEGEYIKASFNLLLINVLFSFDNHERNR